MTETERTPDHREPRDAPLPLHLQRVEGAGRPSRVRQIDVPVHPISRFESMIGLERYGELCAAAMKSHDDLDGRTVWNVSSTASGGGVAEMLQVIIGYTLDAGIDVRWLVISGDPEFFAITKRIHNRIHGTAGDDGQLGPPEADHYRAVTTAAAEDAVGEIQPGDVVLLHDPQTAGMAPLLAARGARVVWRCHIGRAMQNSFTEEAWKFLRPYLEPCDAYVFSLREYAPPFLDEELVWIIPPSIDPFAPKNQELSSDTVLTILRGIGLLAGGSGDERPASFTRRDGSTGFVQRRATILSVDGDPLEADVPLVVQVSRWDRLKDMAGVMRGFADRVVGRGDAHLALVGPATSDVSDDPEGAEVFAECSSAWSELPMAARRRVHLVSLPLDDIDENAAMVNAIQCHATVIVQKSLEEGFGLTVAEGMWKARAVVASKVGGIAAQIAPGTGVLLDDPADLDAFGDVLASLLGRPDEIAELGRRARGHVLEGFVGDRHLIRYAELIGWLVHGRSD